MIVVSYFFSTYSFKSFTNTNRIIIPENPAAAKSLAPKIASRLGNGSIAILKEQKLFIIEPGGKTISEGAFTKDKANTLLLSMSPKGDALLYIAGTKENAYLRLMDFTIGKDFMVTKMTPKESVTTHTWGKDKLFVAIAEEASFIELETRILKVTLTTDKVEKFNIKASDPEHNKLLQREIGLLSVSPDGKFLLCQGFHNGKSLFLANTTSGKAKKLDFGEGASGSAVFAPDGENIVFMENDELKVANINNNSTRIISDASYPTYYLAGKISPASHIAIGVSQTEKSVILESIDLSSSQIVKTFLNHNNAVARPLGFTSEKNFLILHRIREKDRKQIVLGCLGVDIADEGPFDVIRINPLNGDKETLYKDVTNASLAY